MKKDKTAKSHDFIRKQPVTYEDYACKISFMANYAGFFSVFV